MTGAAGGAPTLGAVAAAWAGARRVRVDGWRMRYREAGCGAPLVLVHGLGVSADYWFRNGPPLAAAGFRVLAPDLPGFGRTAGPDGGLAVPAQAEALRRWSEAMELDPAVYVGHSLSCQTVLELAAGAPERVRGLVLQAPTGAPRRPRLLWQALGFLRDIPREDLRLVPPVAQAYLRAGPLRVFRTWRRGTEHDPLSLLPRVHAPSLVVLGERDPVVPRDFAEELAAGLPGTGRVAYVAHAAHAAHFGNAAEFNRVVVDFVRGLG